MPNRRMPIRLLIPLTETGLAKILTCAVGGALTGGVLYVVLHPISYGIVNLCLLAGVSCGISWAINHKKARQVLIAFPVTGAVLGGVFTAIARNDNLLGLALIVGAYIGAVPALAAIGAYRSK